MSRVFKDKPVKVGENKTKATSTSRAKVDSRSQGQTDQGVTLVAATPQKRARLQPPGLPASTRISRSPTPGGAVGDVEEEDWSLPSSPDVLLLGDGSDGIDEPPHKRPFGAAGHILASETPVKKRRRS
jgi:hypothetical protein